MMSQLLNQQETLLISNYRYCITSLHRKEVTYSTNLKAIKSISAYHKSPDNYVIHRQCKHLDLPAGRTAQDEVALALRHTCLPLCLNDEFC
jgi:hypothetical protein